MRAALDEDLAWLRELYASTRTEEMAPVPWPDATKRAFLDQQFELQHHHFLSHFADAEFWLLEASQGPVGRLYRHCPQSSGAVAAPDDLIVDISFLPAWRGLGFGTGLLQAAQTAAAERGRGLRLHVHAHNTAAASLYRRLGFVAISDTSGPQSHVEMRWPGRGIS